jgi:hypothetical protein
MWWVVLVVMVGLLVAQAQTRQAPLTSNEQKLDALQTAVDGSALPRYQDNGDGTITDRQTGLMWVKLDDAGGPLDKDIVRNWNDATSTWLDQVNSLNTTKAGKGADVTMVSFAGGYTDWRLPTIVELQTILDTSVPGCGVSPFTTPCVDSIFNTNCTAGCTNTALNPKNTCSCTAASGYWSTASDAHDPSGAWDVDFLDGDVDFTFKNFSLHVRAVRCCQ